jgi:tetratricopeptide (TPR) repeat protein
MLALLAVSFSVFRDRSPNLSSRAAFGMQTISVTHPDISTSEAGVQAHVQETRMALDQTLSTNATPAVRATAWAQLGRVYFAYEFYPAAAGCFSNAVVLQPGNGQFWYGLAESRFENAEIDGAITAMNEAMRQTSSPDELNHCRRFLGDAFERAGRTVEARREFETVIEKQPQDVYSLIKAGRLAAQAGDSARAVTILEAALKAAPQRREVIALLAQENRKLGREEAAQAFSRTLQTTDATRKIPELVRSDPWRTSTKALDRSSVALHGRGIAAMKAGYFKQAIDALEAALQSEPKHIPTRISLAFCRLELGEVIPAGDLFLNVLNEEPANESARKGLALALVRSGRGDDAVRFCTMWQTEKPTEALAVRTEAEVRMIQRDYKGAAVAYQRLTNMEPSEVVGPMGLAMAQAGQGLHADARTTLESAAEKLQGRAEIIHTLARLFITSPQDNVRNPRRALELTEGLARGDATVVVWETRALALAENGSWDEALTLLRSAIQRSGNIGGPALARRLKKVEAALSARQTFREPWPFAEEESPSAQ